MCHTHMCSVVTELIAGSLNVNDTIRATRAGSAQLTTPRPELGNSRAIQRRLHLWQTPFSTHPSCLPNLDIHYQVCRWMQPVLLGHSFFRPPLPPSSFFLHPFFPSPSFYISRSPLQSLGGVNGFLWFLLRTVGWKMLSSSVTKEAVH